MHGFAYIEVATTSCFFSEGIFRWLKIPFFQCMAEDSLKILIKEFSDGRRFQDFFVA
jgi:hypothetical protein